jgi:hypothetical protein
MAAVTQALPAGARLFLRSPGRLGEGLVELEFGPDDEERFFVARDELLDRFERWLDAQGRSVELHGDAELLLGFKRGVLNGHLGRWRTAISTSCCSSSIRARPSRMPRGATAASCSTSHRTYRRVGQF